MSFAVPGSRFSPQEPLTGSGVAGSVRAGMRATRLLLMLAMAWGMPSGAQVTNGLLVNSFETSADLLRFTRNNCSVSSSTEGGTDGQKAALVVFSNAD